MRPLPCCPRRPLAQELLLQSASSARAGGLASGHRHRCRGCSSASWHQCLGFLDLGRKKTCYPLHKPHVRSSCSSSSGPAMRPLSASHRHQNSELRRFLRPRTSSYFSIASIQDPFLGKSQHLLRGQIAPGSKAQHLKRSLPSSFSLSARSLSQQSCFERSIKRLSEITFFSSNGSCLQASSGAAANTEAYFSLFSLKVLLLSVEQCVLHKEGSRPLHRIIVSNTTSLEQLR